MSATPAPDPKSQVFCGECHILVAPYAKKQVEGKVTYHEDCYLKLIRKRYQIPPTESIPTWMLRNIQ